MADSIQTTTNLSDSIRAQYEADYFGQAWVSRLYDQLAVPFPGLSEQQAMQGSSVVYPFLGSMAPGTTTISQVADVTPTSLVDATSSITPTSRWGALQWAEALEIQAYTNYGSERFKKLGENMMETIEILALDAATLGDWVERAAVRASIDKDTSGHRASDALFRKYHSKMLSLRVPGFMTNDGRGQVWSAIMHPAVFHDIAESGNVDSIGLYQQAGIHLNFELGQIGPFRLVVSPFAKVFMGAGADATTSNVATLVGTAANPLDTTLVTADDVSSSITYGELWTVGTEETSAGGVNYPTNERIKVLSASTTTLTILGEGENGGLRYAHPVTDYVRNADSVYTIVFGGPSSLVKLYTPAVGEYGKTVGPHVTGILEQFRNIGWKFYGNYDRLTENRILRYECSSSLEV